MTFQKKQLVCLALGASVLSLGACSYNHPNAMPSGYTYHHEAYKSPISPTSKKITVEQRKYMDAAQAEQFRDAVYDLLERLTMRAGMPPKPVYVMAPDPMTTFYANIDNDLRESMRHIGYAISDMPTEAYIFTYEAMPIEQAESAGVNNVVLTLRVFDSLSEDAHQLTEETGQYFIQGIEELNITPSIYNLLPSQKKVAETQKRQEVQMEAPQLVAPPSIPVAPVIEPVMPVITESFVPPAPSQPIISEPIAIEPVVAAPKIQAKRAVKKFKKPSRDDIVIINRGDASLKAVSVDSPDITMPIAPSQDALQDAIPTAKSVVRGRVSQPANY